MFGNLFGLWRAKLEAHNENPVRLEPVHSEEAVDASAVRALATGAALATAVDSSTAVVIGIYDYAHRYRDKGRRSA